MWDIPRPGPEPLSPALAGGFLTTVPPGKPDTNLKTNLLDKNHAQVLAPRKEHHDAVIEISKHIGFTNGYLMLSTS